MRYLGLAAAIAIFGAGLTGANAATDGALVGLHDLRREGNKTCMSEHFHNGSSNGLANRSQAEAAALRNWSEFTAFEYGGHWGSTALAGSKSMKCSQGSSGWSCDFDARPCKR
jgi:hypothetical protein